MCHTAMRVPSIMACPPETPSIFTMWEYGVRCTALFFVPMADLPFRPDYRPAVRQSQRGCVAPYEDTAMEVMGRAGSTAMRRTIRAGRRPYIGLSVRLGAIAGIFANRCW